MQFYGDTYTEISILIKKITNKSVFFSNFKESPSQLYEIPKIYLHTEKEIKLGEQILKIPTWYLKRNRIIPLN